MVAAKGKTVGLILIAIAALLAIFIYATFDPETTPFPKCPFFWATGLKCPGCGSQRALHQLLHLHVGAAFRYNALFVCALPLIILILVSELLKNKYPGLRRAFQNPYFGWSIVVITLLWWILRNIFGW